jgi:hypothetical protein
VDDQICWEADGIEESSTRREKVAVSTGKAVVAAPSCCCSCPPPWQVPLLKVCVAATAWVMLPAPPPVHETRRTRDIGTPVALAKEQRMSVMLEADRVVLPASKITLRTARGGRETGSSAAEEDRPSPTPRPIASAARMAKRRQRGQKVPARRFSCLLSSADDDETWPAALGARMVRPSWPMETTDSNASSTTTPFVSFVAILR